MNSNISYTSISASIRFKTWCCTVLVVCIFGTLGLDWITARLSQSSFYFSESFLFSSFWWLFVPGLLLQFRLAHSFKSIGSQVLLIALPALWHLFAYPALVWMLSSAFYDHSFAYRQTLHFELQAYSFVLLFAYTLPFIFFKIGNNKIQVLEKAEAPAQVPDVVSTITSLWVNDGKRKIQIYPRDIFYITSSSPYIYLHLQQKKYLHSQSLKSILQQLDENQFVQIHKSCLVNIHTIACCTSRLNGDYDLTLTNGIVLRLSRNYVPLFRKRTDKAHQVTP